MFMLMSCGRITAKLSLMLSPKKSRSEFQKIWGALAGKASTSTNHTEALTADGFNSLT
jgi:hypothetical protein